MTHWTWKWCFLWEQGIRNELLILSFISAITSVRPLGQYCTSHSMVSPKQWQNCAQCVQLGLYGWQGRAQCSTEPVRRSSSCGENSSTWKPQRKFKKGWCECARVCVEVWRQRTMRAMWNISWSLQLINMAGLSALQCPSLPSGPLPVPLCPASGAASWPQGGSSSHILLL